METSPLSARGTCVLCDRTFRADRPHTGPPIGFCASCAAELHIVPVEDLLSLDAAAGDRLPLGFITVDRDGIIVAFNAMETTLQRAPRVGRGGAQLLSRRGALHLG